MPPSRASLPDPAYLDCHYRVAEILHASGLAEYIERKIQDWEDLKQSGGTDGALRPDGSTDVTRILNTALWNLLDSTCVYKNQLNSGSVYKNVTSREFLPLKLLLS
ncbi:hypothetical protein IFM47457_06523 [Aspergillus lentulus]|nr:hypothetical protein IFM47457_06523 [Aspergillus lentulus]